MRYVSRRNFIQDSSKAGPAPGTHLAFGSRLLGQSAASGGRTTLELAPRSYTIVPWSV